MEAWEETYPKLRDRLRELRYALGELVSMMGGPDAPEDVRVVDALPLTSMDKVYRRALGARLSSPS